MCHPSWSRVFASRLTPVFRKNEVIFLASYDAATNEVHHCYMLHPSGERWPCPSREFFDRDRFRNECIMMSSTGTWWNPARLCSAPWGPSGQFLDQEPFSSTTADGQLVRQPVTYKRRSPEAASPERDGRSRIDDLAAVDARFDHLLRGLEQSTCQMVADLWMQLSGPQRLPTPPGGSNGYTTAPEWWPNRPGDDDAGGHARNVQHTDPEHMSANGICFSTRHPPTHPPSLTL